MKIIDANVMLYAVNSDMRQCESSRRWLQKALTSTETVGFPWVCLLAFIRISTNTRLFARPLLPIEAFDLIDSWLAAPNAMTVEPTTQHAQILRGLLEQAGSAGNLTTDAHIAALAVQYAATVVTFDRDLSRFGVDVLVPD